MMNLATMTPTEIDAILGDLDTNYWTIQDKIDSRIDTIHRVIGERPRLTRSGNVWPTSHSAAINQARTMAAEGAAAPLNYSGRPVAEFVAAYDQAVAASKANRAEAEPYNAEYRRRPWNRFFWARSNNGHAHKSMNCQTCNRNGKPTRFDWTPELSGLTTEEAVEKLGYKLCSVCWPEAPVEWTTGPQKEYCSGSNKAPVAGTEKRYGQQRYGRCTGCPEGADLVRLSTCSGTVKHKPAKKK